MSDTRFEWIDFYSAFAMKLLPYRENRPELIRKVKAVYEKLGMKLPKLEEDGNPVDIDPFTVYALFNKGISNANRIAIIRGFASEFDMNASIPNNFDGIPLVNNLSATFYRFADGRDDHDIDHLWDVFEQALKLADTDQGADPAPFCAAYDAAIVQGGIRWNLSMALYWIRPYTFVNLDSRNRWFMLSPDNMPGDFVVKAKALLNKVPDASTYLEICRMCRNALEQGNHDYKSFPELSYYAWIVSEQDNVRERTETAQKNNVIASVRWFCPIITALKELGGSGTPKEVRGRIIANEHLTAEEVNAVRGKTKVNKFENEVAFSRNYLVEGGYIANGIPGVWALTELGKSTDMTEELATDIFRTSVANRRTGKNVTTEDALSDTSNDSVRYWLYAPGEGAAKWDIFYKAGIAAIGWGEIGDLSAFDSKEDMKAKMKEVFGTDLSYRNAAHATWQFAQEMKPGDIIFVKRGRHQFVGRGVVTSDYYYDDTMPDDYNNVRKVNWTHRGEWSYSGNTTLKTLTDVTPYTDFVEQMNALFEPESEEDVEEKEVIYPPYTMEDFLEEVYMDQSDYETLVALLRNKKNIILQGAPGVGKTFAAKRLAYSIMGTKDRERVMMVQFHQSYSYEDFIMGFRPSATGFELRQGAFYRFCKTAADDLENDYFFIIDEINRGNLSKIFGELFMLIENDKRGIELQLLYSNEKFAVPENVYIIGMMNTADRSLAMLDYALRRRFAFFELKPGFASEGFRAYRANLDNARFDRLIGCAERLNRAIAEDESLGEGFCIGHSYFCNLTPGTIDDRALSGIVEYELIPLLKEYWFDEPLKVRDWSANLRSAIQ